MYETKTGQIGQIIGRGVDESGTHVALQMTNGDIEFRRDSAMRPLTPTADLKHSISKNKVSIS